MIRAGVLAATLAALVFLGPRVEVDTRVPEVTFPDSSPPAVAGWIAEGEARHDDLVPGTEKTVVWADSTSRSSTPLSLVYLHGFSATRQEVYPLAEELARSLGANLFLTPERSFKRKIQ